MTLIYQEYQEVFDIYSKFTVPCGIDQSNIHLLCGLSHNHSVIKILIVLKINTKSLEYKI